MSFVNTVTFVMVLNYIINTHRVELLFIHKIAMFFRITCATSLKISL